MTRLLFIVSMFFLFLSCNANERKNKNLTKTEKYGIDNTRIEQLKKAYEKRDYKSFFKLFPKTYYEFLNFYGYSDSLGEQPLYTLYEKHINYLFQYENSISPEIFAEKVYSIAENGLWDADAVGLFQVNLSQFIIDKPNIFIKILTTKSEKEVKSFWHFVFDGSSKNDLQNKNKFNVTYKKINSLDERQSLVLKSEFEKMYK
jgi:hypothetical protein